MERERQIARDVRIREGHATRRRRPVLAPPLSFGARWSRKERARTQCAIPAGSPTLHSRPFCPSKTTLTTAGEGSPKRPPEDLAGEHRQPCRAHHCLFKKIGLVALGAPFGWRAGMGAGAPGEGASTVLMTVGSWGGVELRDSTGATQSGVTLLGVHARVVTKVTHVEGKTRSRRGCDCGDIARVLLPTTQQGRHRQLGQGRHFPFLKIRHSAQSAPFDCPLSPSG
jgi:hypothetical protein